MTSSLTTSTTPYSIAMLAADGFMFILFFLVGTYFAWRALGILRWDKFVSDPHGPQARMLRFFLAMLGGLISGLVVTLYFVAGQALRSAF